MAFSDAVTNFLQIGKMTICKALWETYYPVLLSIPVCGGPQMPFFFRIRRLSRPL